MKYLILILLVICQIGCGEDQKKSPQEVWSLKAPVIEKHAGGIESVRSFNAKIKYNLLDAFQFEESDANIGTELIINSSCGSENSFLKGQLQKKYYFYELINQQILRMNIKNQLVQCDFIFSAVNINGNRHNFNIENVNIDINKKLLKKTQLTDKNGKTPDALGLFFDELNFSAIDDGQISCGLITAKINSIENVNSIFFTNKLSVNCSVMYLKKNQLFVSKVFRLNKRVVGPTFELERSLINYQIMKGDIIHVGLLHISNNESIDLNLVIRKSEFSGALYYNAVYPKILHLSPQKVLLTTPAEFKLENSSFVEESEHYYTIQLKAKESVSLNINAYFTDEEPNVETGCIIVFLSKQVFKAQSYDISSYAFDLSSIRFYPVNKGINSFFITEALGQPFTNIESLKPDLSNQRAGSLSCGAYQKKIGTIIGGSLRLF